ncbi:MAG: hypothetical protein LW838_03680 [Nitrosomonadaceae bacterium]|nr:hypothetical protein [Nitrosomonadaceae bacterium]
MSFIHGYGSTACVVEGAILFRVAQIVNFWRGGLSVIRDSRFCLIVLTTKGSVDGPHAPGSLLGLCAKMFYFNNLHQKMSLGEA